MDVIPVSLQFAISLAIGLVGGLVARVHRFRVMRMTGGLVAVLVAAIGMAQLSDIEYEGLLLSVFLLLAGGFLACTSSWFYLIAAAGGVFLVMSAGYPDRPLFRAVSILYLLGVGWAVHDLEKRRGALAPLMLAISLVGIYFTIPQASLAVPLLGGSVAFLVHPKLGSGPVMAIVGLAIWISAVGGSTRTGSIVGAMACFGVLIVEPFAHAAAQRWSAIAWVYDESRLGFRFLLTVHLLLVTFTSRVAGFRVKSEPALIMAVLAFAVGWALLFYQVPASFGRRWTATHDPSTDG